MPFKTVAKLGKGKKADVLRDVPGIQTRQEVKDIVLEVIKDRRTIREFHKKPVDDNILMKILDCARYAPSAGNQQPWEFIIIKDDERKKRLAVACFEQECIVDAPVLVVVAVNMRLATSKYKERGEKLYGIQGVSAAIENMLLAAEALGVGSAWIGAFSEKAVAVLTECPDYIRPAAIVAFGYPAEEPPMPARQSLKDLIHYERFGETYITREIYKNGDFF